MIPVAAGITTTDPGFVIETTDATEVTWVTTAFCQELVSRLHAQVGGVVARAALVIKRAICRMTVGFLIYILCPVSYTHLTLPTKA